MIGLRRGWGTNSSNRSGLQMQTGNADDKTWQDWQPEAERRDGWDRDIHHGFWTMSGHCVTSILCNNNPYILEVRYVQFSTATYYYVQYILPVSRASFLFLFLFSFCWRERNRDGTGSLAVCSSHDCSNWLAYPYEVLSHQTQKDIRSERERGKKIFALTAGHFFSFRKDPTCFLSLPISRLTFSSSLGLDQFSANSILGLVLLVVWCGVCGAYIGVLLFIISLSLSPFHHSHKMKKCADNGRNCRVFKDVLSGWIEGRGIAVFNDHHGVNMWGSSWWWWRWWLVMVDYKRNNSIVRRISTMSRRTRKPLTMMYLWYWTNSITCSSRN